MQQIFSAEHHSPFFIKLSFACAILIIASTGVLYLPMVLRWVGQILIGIVFVQFVELQHDLLHDHILKSEKLSSVLGFVLGLPMLIVNADYEYHHALSQQLTLNSNKKFTHKQFLSIKLMLMHYQRIFYKLWQSFFSPSFYQDVSTEVARTIRLQYRLLGSLIAVSIFISFYYKTSCLLEIWLLPLIMIALPVQALLDLTDYTTGCQLTATNVFKKF